MVHFRLSFYLQFLEGRFSHYICWYSFMIVWMVSFSLLCVADCFSFFIVNSFAVGIVYVCLLGCESVPTSYSPLVPVSTLRTQWSWTSVNAHFLPCSSHTVQDTVNADTLPRFYRVSSHPVSFPLKGPGQGWASPSLSVCSVPTSLDLRRWLFSLPTCDSQRLFFSLSCCTQLLPVWRFTSLAFNLSCEYLTCYQRVYFMVTSFYCSLSDPFLNLDQMGYLWAWWSFKEDSYFIVWNF